MKAIAFYSLLLLIQPSYAAIGKKVNSDYESVVKKITTLKKNIQQVEAQLGDKNKEYLQVVADRQKIDMDIYELEKNIASNIHTLNLKKNELNYELKKVLLSQLDDNDTTSLIKKKILKERILTNKREIEAQIKNERSISQSLLNLKLKYQEKVKIEHELYNIVVNLESNKTEYVKDYLTSKENAEVLKANIKTKVVEVKVDKKIDNITADFKSPLKSFISKEYENKGITYAVREIVDVYATKSGEVVHTGSLANYGNVIMIDHGSDLRSIYLGDLSSNLKKGDKVQVDSIIGKTRKSIRKEAIGKVYFEIRNKNKVQNTIKLVMNERSQV